MPTSSDPLWVMTTYYNPAGYRSRLQNFNVFRRQLNAPLMVIELAKPGQHRLKEDDADIVLRLVGEDRIWQKERLLNIGVAELPSQAEYVAWVDCDVVFEDANWVSKAQRRLSRNGGMLQLFETSVHLPQTADKGSLTPASCEEFAPIMRGVSIASALAASEFDANEIKLTRARAQPELIEQYRLAERHNCYGMAWSAPVEAVRAAGFYDRNVVGGGDAVQVFAALSRLDDYWALRPHTPAQKQDALDWMARARSSRLFANIDCLEGKLYHLWHGTIENRDYRGRYNILYRNDFDPKRDIELARNGTWRWSDPQGVLAQDVGRYFQSRREDGDA